MEASLGQARTRDVTLILLHGVRKLGSNIFQFHAQLGIGVLEIVFLLHDLSQHAFASL